MGLYRVFMGFGDFTPTTENQMEHQMANKMEATTEGLCADY